jgi:hypothetical protein
MAVGQATNSGGEILVEDSNRDRSINAGRAGPYQMPGHNYINLQKRNAFH